MYEGREMLEKGEHDGKDVVLKALNNFTIAVWSWVL